MVLFKLNQTFKPERQILLSLTIRMRAIEKYFPVVLFIMLHMVLCVTIQMKAFEHCSFGNTVYNVVQGGAKKAPKYQLLIQNRPAANSSRANVFEFLYKISVNLLHYFWKLILITIFKPLGV